MEFDLVIRNGTVVDGSGARPVPGRRRVSATAASPAIGRIRERGARRSTPRATSSRPGFIDGHTHMDAQVFWDPLGTCSCWHGVTDRGDGQLRLHAGARPSPTSASSSSATSSGPRTSRRPPWPPASTGRGRPSPSTSTPSTGRPRASTTRPTSAIRPCGPRRWASGPSRSRPPRTTSAVMERELRDALRAGAIGFTTSRSDQHETSDDRPVAVAAGVVGRGAPAGRRHGRPRRRRLRAGPTSRSRPADPEPAPSTASPAGRPGRRHRACR